MYRLQSVYDLEMRVMKEQWRMVDYCVTLSPQDAGDCRRGHEGNATRSHGIG